MTDSSHSIEEALDICLARMRAEESAEECMRDFPQYVGELEPLLAAAAQLCNWIPPELSIRARTAARTRARLALRRAHRQRESWRWGSWALRLGTAVLLAIALFGGGVAFAGSSLPGSPLYGVKRAGESARLAFTRNNADRARLNLALAQLRIDEIIAVAKAGQRVDPQLIADLDGSYLATARAICELAPEQRPGLLVIYRAQIEAHQVVLTKAQTSGLPDSARQALDAASRASAGADTLLASEIRRHAPEVSPAPTLAAATITATAVTPTVIPSPHPSATRTVTPSAMPSAMPTIADLPAPTIRPSATLRPRPRPISPVAPPAELPSNPQNGVTPEPTSQNPGGDPPRAVRTPAPGQPSPPESPRPPEPSPPESPKPEPGHTERP
ncbi:MAG: DUF5667 domain-containing protein, partial [Chloroflexales bacterium]